MSFYKPIGVFDSGYGGLTVLKSILEKLPEYDYLYLGDNARAPYGPRSFETVYRYTLESVKWFFDQGCDLIILACNTASAKALRTIQQKDLPGIDPTKRVLGVIRPTAEVIGQYTSTGHVGILATNGTVQSNSYPLEILKYAPDVCVFQEPCPMWVPLVENNEYLGSGADFFIEKNVKHLLEQSDKIDTILLGCTHYPLLATKIEEYLPAGVRLLSQGEIVAASLDSYLYRHPEIASRCSSNRQRDFFTTDSPEDFESHAGIFFGSEVAAKHASL
jgi:glutamate racemase